MHAAREPMKSLDTALTTRYPHLSMTPADLLKQEGYVDLGEAATTYTRITTEVTAAK